MSEPAILQEPARITPAKYLVCVDTGSEALVALRFACIKAKKRGGQVAVLYVMPNADVRALSSVADKMRAERAAEAETLLGTLREEALRFAGIAIETIVREGSPGDEIIKYVMEDVDTNMLVLGVPQQAKRGKLMTWLASQLGNKLLIPLMLVPGNLTDQQIEELS